MKLWAVDKLNEIMSNYGGIVDCHRHLDRQDTLDQISHEAIKNGATLAKKWRLTRELKQDPRYLNNLAQRLQEGIEDMIDQGIIACRTYIDVDSLVGLEALKIALGIKKEYKDIFYLQIAASPVAGFENDDDLMFFLQGCEMADIIGGLPSRSRQGVKDYKTSLDYMRFLFKIAKDLDSKPIDMQVDQENDPDEIETRLLAGVAFEAREQGYTGQVAATHCISISAYEDDYLQDTISLLKKAQVDVIVCPGAALSMKQKRQKQTPTHNSIAPVMELVKAGITVGIGTDNVSDIYMPFTTGDIREEIREMARAIRFQEDIDILARIATVNGRKILGI